MTDLAAGRTFRAPGSIANDFFILLGNIFSPGTVLLTNGNAKIFPFTLNFGYNGAMATVTRRIRPEIAVANRPKRRRPTRQIRMLVQLSALTAAIVGLWLLWNLTATTVEIEVDGVTESVQTHRRAVGDLLTDIGLLLGPEAAIEEVVAQGSRVPVQVTQTHGLTGEAAATTAGAAALAAPQESLRLSHNLDTRITEGLQVSVVRPRPFRIFADGRRPRSLVGRNLLQS